MDETQIILLLAVIAVLVLAVAVVILLPKEKVVSSEKGDEDKQKKKQRSNKPKRVHVPTPSIKGKSIKGFDDVEDANNADELLEFLKGKDVQLNTVGKEEKKRVQQEEVEEDDQDEDDDFTKITKKKKSEGAKEEKRPKQERKKAKKLFFKPEVYDAMREGRKKDREERKNDGAAPTTEEKPKKKKEESTSADKPAEQTPQDKKPEKKDKKPYVNNKDKKDHEGEQPSQSGSGQDQGERKRPPRVGGLGRGTGLPKGPGPIRNTGLEPASLDDMLSAITHFYGDKPSIFKKNFAANPSGNEKRPNNLALVNIASFLPLRDVLKLAVVDRFFHNFIKREEKLWKELCRRDFGLTKKLPNSKSWKHTYRVSHKKP